jgi:hypothetical protein
MSIDVPVYFETSRHPVLSPGFKEAISSKPYRINRESAREITLKVDSPGKG